jgi:hypothetical protein
MTIAMVGAGPRAACARLLLAQAFPGHAIEEASPAPETLARHSASPPSLLVLVDPLPFAAPLAELVGPTFAVNAERLRSDGLRAVLALELARRSAHTVVLDGEAAAWPGRLSSLAGAAFIPALVDYPLPPRDAEIGGGLPALKTYLAPLWQAAVGGRAPAIAWPREAFFDGDAPGEQLPAIIEVAGRARIVAYGPYLPVPAGQWRARACLGFSPDIGRLPFILEIDSGAGVSRGFFEAERGGFFSLDLDFAVTEPLHPLEARLITQDSALEGQAALIELRLEPA